jgi:CheY-like chemotaxis protein
MAKILIVEDDAFIIRLYSRLFNYSGFEIITAASGDEGLLKARSENPTLIILDIMMPGLSGMEVLKTLKKDPNLQKIPVVLLTNVSDDNVMNDAFRLGAAGYIIKSQIANEELISEVGSYLPK